MKLLEAIIFGLPLICGRCGKEFDKLDAGTGMCWPCVYATRKEKEGRE